MSCSDLPPLPGDLLAGLGGLLLLSLMTQGVGANRFTSGDEDGLDLRRNAIQEGLDLSIRADKRGCNRRNRNNETVERAPTAPTTVCLLFALHM